MVKLLRLGRNWTPGIVSMFVLLAALWFNNCGKVYQAKTQIKISSSCNQSKLVTVQELDRLMFEGHLSDKNQRIRCPGFFAVLEDDETRPQAQQKAAQAGDDCNQNGLPNEPEIPSPSLAKEALIKELVFQTKAQNIQSWVKAMSDGSLWPTRYHASTFNNQVATWIQNEFKKLAAGRDDVQVRLVPHQNTPQNSVEVMIRGKDSSSEKYVVMGGHQDSIELNNSRTNPDSRSPGADDNASGVASLLEAFRVLMVNDFHPDTNLVFYTYAAEEVGLVGSQEIARSYAEANKEVLGVMQIDMSMFSTQATDQIYLISDFTSTAMNQLATRLIEEYLHMNVQALACGYACSDHASWTKYNYPSFMPAEFEVHESVNRIHTVRDLADDSTNANYAAHFSQLAIAFAIYLSQTH